MKGILVAFIIINIVVVCDTATFSTEEKCSGKSHITIKIALLDSFIPSFTSPAEMYEILNGYSWETNEVRYEFRVKWVKDFQIANGILRKENFSILLIPGIGKEFWRILDDEKLSRWKNEIRNFVANGGGYFGSCGGANIASLGLLSPQKRGWESWTVWEWFMNKSVLGIAPVKSYQDMADPIASSIIWKNPSRVGMSAYVWYNLSINGTGICQKCKINTSHPIFQGYKRGERIIRWVAGPALLPVSKNVTVLAEYPDENISGPNGNKSTCIHAWKYKPNPFDFWQMEDEIIETHIAEKPCAISCRYGNGRVVIFGNHPEHPVWKRGEIFERDTHKNHLLFKGLFQWKNREYLPTSYNWWIVRRSIAWCAKIPDNELPPIEDFGEDNLIK